MASKDPNLWTDAELRIAVEAYLYMLQLQLRGIDFSCADITNALLKKSLKRRNEASLRYRMRNISWVFSQNNLPTISSYSPASGVGSGVKIRIESILSHVDDRRFSFLNKNSLSSVKQKDVAKNKSVSAIEKLNKLYNALGDLETPTVGIGHNQPPEYEISLDISEIKRDIQILKNELNKSNYSIKIVTQEQKKLTTFGADVVGWIGGRLTKFTDAILASLVAVTIAKLTNILPVLIDAIEAIGQLIP